MIQETSFKELDKSTTEFTILIDSLDVWKFSRWLELIEAYDCSRKSNESRYSKFLVIYQPQI